MRVAGISFDHMHMGDLLGMAAAHPEAEIVALHDPDPARMAPAAEAHGLGPDALFTDLDALLAARRPDLAILCSAPADHAPLAARLLAAGVHVLIEKPFADSVEGARTMVVAAEAANRTLAVNWPLAWVPSHATTKRLIDDGLIGPVTEVHHYGGNRGPLYHLAGKVEVSREEVERQKPGSWWYRAASGGGSLLDYLGYGAALGTWFRGGEAPLEVTCATWAGEGVEVDEHSVTVCRYEGGLSKMETRWGTFTDPWTIQPQPKCGFVVVGREGTISSYDYEDHVTVQTRDRPEPARVPVDALPPGGQDPIQAVLAHLGGAPLHGLLQPGLNVIAQRIVDTAARAARERRTLPLVP